MHFTMQKTELVLVPTPLKGHQISIIELANELLSRDHRFSITILLIKPPFSSESPLTLQAHRDIQYVDVPPPKPVPSPDPSQSLEIYLTDYMARHKSGIKDVIAERFANASDVKLSGLILDFFFSPMVSVAEELDVPSYLYFTSNAAFLGFLLFFHSRHCSGGAVLSQSDPDLTVPSYAAPVPARVLPAFALSKSRGYDEFVSHGGELKRVKGFIINTVSELEPYATGSLVVGGTPRVYTVGPLIDRNGRAHRRSKQDNEIMGWLDSQPAKSVVFLCFGSLGGLAAGQLRQLAMGLEQSGQRFLWSVSKAPSEDDDFLPAGFTERTKGVGMVCGWAPQVAVLAHEAVGGFVSHCGWNSILESLWFGVPIATWPMYAEQQLNAFQMVRDLELAVELRLDYRLGGDEVATGSEVASAIGRLMDDRTVRKKVADMSEILRKAIAENGSSFESLRRLIDDVIANATP